MTTVPATGSPPVAFDWYRGFIQFVLDGEWYTWLGPLVACGEWPVGIAAMGRRASARTRR
jgi:thiosulfate dehydrogenase [quinone] large subunit